MPRIFFATDLHGSELCWRKFLNAAKFYEADVLICGGDMTGKAIVPSCPRTGTTLSPSAATAGGRRGQVAEVEAKIRRKGYYPLQMSVERLHELDQNAVDARGDAFSEVMLEGVDRWMKMAAEKLRGTGIRCFVCPGNDDEMEVDEVVRRAELVELGEGRVVEIDGFTMISTGWSNPTPWNTHREDSEEKLAERIEAWPQQVAGRLARDLQPALPSVQVRARRSAGDRRRPEAPARRSSPAAGRLDGRPSGDRETPTAAFAPRPYS